MTTPRDAIAGLIKELRWPRNIRSPDDLPEQVRLRQAAATQLDSLLKERDALQARVKELEQEVEAFQRHEQTLRDNGIASHSEAVVRVVDAEARALRAEQERDEAYERAADAMWKAVDPSMEGILREAAERADVAIRRLSAGPEKITAASYVEERK